MPEQSTPLRDMINGALSRGATYREIEKRAIDPQTGKKASRSIFFDIASGKLDRMPYEHHLRAIAAGLRAPYESVRQAAIAQWLPGAGAPLSTEDEPDAEREQMIKELRELRQMADDALARLGDSAAESDVA